MENENLENIVERLTSNDANDRVKAAADLGEVGTPNEAHHLLKAVYEDEASTVKQIAIQAYAEIMKDEAFEEVAKVAQSHPDEYVQFYAITVLGAYPRAETEEILSNFLNHESEKIRAVSIRSMIHLGASNLSETLSSHLLNEPNPLVKRNIIEALAIWRYKSAFSKIQEIFEKTSDLELKTICAFYGASFGNKDMKVYLETGDVDNFIRINVNDTTFRGRNGLLEALKFL